MRNYHVDYIINVDLRNTPISTFETTNTNCNRRINMRNNRTVIYTIVMVLRKNGKKFETSIVQNESGDLYVGSVHKRGCKSETFRISVTILPIEDMQPQSKNVMGHRLTSSITQLYRVGKSDHMNGGTHQKINRRESNACRLERCYRTFRRGNVVLDALW